MALNLQHQRCATGTDMAEMHWFMLEGGMFTEIQPDSVKVKHRLRHENPALLQTSPAVASSPSRLHYGAFTLLSAFCLHHRFPPLIRVISQGYSNLPLTTDLTQQSPKWLVYRREAPPSATWHLPQGSDFTRQMRDQGKDKVGDEVAARLHMTQGGQENTTLEHENECRCSQRNFPKCIFFGAIKQSFIYYSSYRDELITYKVII